MKKKIQTPLEGVIEHMINSYGPINVLEAFQTICYLKKNENNSLEWRNTAEAISRPIIQTNRIWKGDA